MQEFIKLMYMADGGADGGGDPAPQTEPTPNPDDVNPGEKTVTMTQAEIDALVQRSIAKGAKKAQKELEKAKDTEPTVDPNAEAAEKLRQEREAFEKEKLIAKTSTLLKDKGYILEDSDLNTELVGMIADADEETQTRKLTVLEKLIEKIANAQAGERFAGVKPVVPGATKPAEKTIGEIFREQLRAARNK
jgi:uncharacterized protein YutD